MRAPVQILVAGIASMAAAAPVAAKVRLPAIFGNHMVLQQAMADPVWGWAAPHEKITVSFAGQRLQATADRHGNWRVALKPMAASSQPRKFVVQGRRRVVFRDVVVGEVWLCSGQSNMEYPLHGWFRGGNMKRAVAGANHPLIRLMGVAHRFAGTPQKNCGGHWTRCTPATAKSFSAVAYFFGRDLHAKLHVPFGLIMSDFGGTEIQPWTPELAYATTPGLHREYLLLKKQQARYPQYQRLLPGYLRAVQHWVRRARKARQAGRPIPEPPQPPPNPVAGNRTNATPLFNAMINPLIPYGIRGVIWYQGENNVGESTAEYQMRLRALVTSWRALWQEGNFPFYIVQIAPYDYGRNSGRHYLEPQIWAAQENVAFTLPNCGLASTMDIGNPHNGHPVDKRDVGYRLALWALAKTYGKKGVVYCGPVYKSMRVRGSKAWITFAHTEGGLAPRDGKPLTWFSIAGRNGHFVPARARIKGNAVVVSARQVPHPAAVEFAYEDIAMPNLMNRAGLPALPFDTRRSALPRRAGSRGGATPPPPPPGGSR